MGGEQLESGADIHRLLLCDLDMENGTYRYRRDSPVDGLTDLLARDIELNGQTTPVFVRQSPNDEGRYQIISGFRRVAALHRLAGLRAAVLVRVYSRCSDEFALRLSISEQPQEL